MNTDFITLDYNLIKKAFKSFKDDVGYSASLSVEIDEDEVEYILWRTYSHDKAGTLDKFKTITELESFLIGMIDGR